MYLDHKTKQKTPYRISMHSEKICAYGRVANLAWFAQDFLGISTESLVFSGNHRFQATWKDWSSWHKVICCSVLCKRKTLKSHKSLSNVYCLDEHEIYNRALCSRLERCGERGINKFDWYRFLWNDSHDLLHERKEEKLRRECSLYKCF